MNGPERFNQSFQQGAPMPKQEKKSHGWTPEVIDKGEGILSYIRFSVDQNVIADHHAQASNAARALGYIQGKQTFKDLNPSIKTYLEYVWWQESPEGKLAALKKNLPALEEEWFERYANNPEDRHAMVHPDDEERFEKSISD
jgi:hypothetical protein